MTPSREHAPKSDRRSQRLRQADELSRGRPIIGWREWLGLPELGIERIKAKIDTGARSCALHAFDIRPTHREGQPSVRFKVHPFQRDNQRTVTSEGTLIDWRWVKSSAGQETLRPVIETTIELMGRRWPIELTLINRDPMGFRMLLGRQALRRRFVVDPGRSFCSGQKPGARRRATKKSKSRTRGKDTQTQETGDAEP